MIAHKQITLAEVFEDCQKKFNNDKYQFLSLLNKAINLDKIVPVSFVTHYHPHTCRPRNFSLCATSLYGSFSSSFRYSSLSNRNEPITPQGANSEKKSRVSLS